jgi:hypothetical protein
MKVLKKLDLDRLDILDLEGLIEVTEEAEDFDAALTYREILIFFKAALGDNGGRLILVDDDVDFNPKVKKIYAYSKARTTREEHGRRHSN